MQHKETSVCYPASYYQPDHKPPGSKCYTRRQAYAIQQAIINQITNHLALNATQGHWCSYPTSYLFSALNATQEHKPSFPTSYIYSQMMGQSDLNVTQGHKPSYQQAIYRFQIMGTIPPVTQTRISG